MSRCLGECRQYGLCSIDCSIAPWNQDRPYVTGSNAPFKLLLRCARWLGRCPDRSDISWVDDPNYSWRFGYRSHPIDRDEHPSHDPDDETVTHYANSVNH